MMNPQAQQQDSNIEEAEVEEVELEEEEIVEKDIYNKSSKIDLRKLKTYAIKDFYNDLEKEHPKIIEEIVKSLPQNKTKFPSFKRLNTIITFNTILKDVYLEIAQQVLTNAYSFKFGNLFRLKMFRAKRNFDFWTVNWGESNKNRNKIIDNAVDKIYEEFTNITKEEIKDYVVNDLISKSISVLEESKFKRFEELKKELEPAKKLDVNEKGNPVFSNKNTWMVFFTDEFYLVANVFKMFYPVKKKPLIVFGFNFWDFKVGITITRSLSKTKDAVGILNFPLHYKSKNKKV